MFFLFSSLSLCDGFGSDAGRGSADPSATGGRVMVAGARGLLDLRPADPIVVVVDERRPARWSPRSLVVALVVALPPVLALLRLVFLPAINIMQAAN